MRMPLLSFQTVHIPGHRLPSIAALLTWLTARIGVGFVINFLSHLF